MTVSYESIQNLTHVLFMTYCKMLLDSKFSGNFKLLEVGCGHGYFAELIKKEYQDRIQVTAIDPSEAAISAAKAKTAGGVDYRNATVADLSSDELLYDVILFTKSLHHVASLKETLSKAYELLQTNGILVLEEVDFDAMDEPSIRWFMDRVDLLNSANRLAPANDKMQQLLDPSVDSFKRWKQFFEESQKHHDMNYGHNHAMFRFREMHDCVARIFGQANVKVDTRLPFFFQFIVYIGNLENSDINRSILNVLRAQEEAAIKNNSINAIGVVAVAEKK